MDLVPSILHRFFLFVFISFLSLSHSSFFAFHLFVSLHFACLSLWVQTAKKKRVVHTAEYTCTTPNKWTLSLASSYNKLPHRTKVLSTEKQRYWHFDFRIICIHARARGGRHKAIILQLFSNGQTMRIRNVCLLPIVFQQPSISVQDGTFFVHFFFIRFSLCRRSHCHYSIALCW